MPPIMYGAYFFRFSENLDGALSSGGGAGGVVAVAAGPGGVATSPIADIPPNCMVFLFFGNDVI